MDNKDKETELLPCPFCGKKARVKATMDGREGIYAWCQCIECYARTAGYSASIRDCEDDAFLHIQSAKEKAIEEWNRRTMNATD